MAERSVSIFYPCYNDWGTMGSMVLLSVQTARRLGLDFDITIVDDGSGVICVEMMAKIHRAGFRHVEVPVHHYQRSHGKSQFFSFPRIARTLWNLSGLWIRMILLRREV